MGELQSALAVGLEIMLRGINIFTLDDLAAARAHEDAAFSGGDDAHAVRLLALLEHHGVGVHALLRRALGEWPQQPRVEGERRACPPRESWLAVLGRRRWVGECPTHPERVESAQHGAQGGKPKQATCAAPGPVIASLSAARAAGGSAASSSRRRLPRATYLGGGRW